MAVILWALGEASGFFRAVSRQGFRPAPLYFWALEGAKGVRVVPFSLALTTATATLYLLCGASFRGRSRRAGRAVRLVLLLLEPWAFQAGLVDPVSPAAYVDPFLPAPLIPARDLVASKRFRGHLPVRPWETQPIASGLPVTNAFGDIRHAAYDPVAARAAEGDSEAVAQLGLDWLVTDRPLPAPFARHPASPWPLWVRSPARTRVRFVAGGAAPDAAAGAHAPGAVGTAIRSIRPVPDGTFLEVDTDTGGWLVFADAPWSGFRATRLDRDSSLPVLRVAGGDAPRG